MEDVFKDIKPLSEIEFEHYKQVEDAVSLASKEVLVEHYCDMHGIEPGYEQNMECCPWSPKYQMFDGHQECSASNECAEFEMAFLSNVCGV